MRLGINIPNDLHRRLVPLKQHVNVSQICREAIEHRIRPYEKALASRSNQDVAKAVARVWEEERTMREVVEVDWGMLGYEDAKCWVETAQLKNWDYLHHRQEVIERQGRPRWDFIPPHLEGMKAFHEHYFELTGRIRQHGDHLLNWLYEEYGGIDRKAAEREYMLAWLAHTDSAWDLFREMRGRYLEERRRDSLEAYANRPDPALPQKLLDELEGGGERVSRSPESSAQGERDAPSL